MGKLVQVFTLKTICKIIVFINQISLDIEMFSKIKPTKIAQIMSKIICYHNSSERLYLLDIIDIETNYF